jgi:hypothetical protein
MLLVPALMRAPTLRVLVLVLVLVARRSSQQCPP